jgi:hypothetical protein
MSLEKLIQEIENEFPCESNESNDPHWKIVIAIRKRLAAFEKRYSMDSETLKKGYLDLMDRAPSSQIRSDYTGWYFLCLEMDEQLDALTAKERPPLSEADVDYERPAYAGLVISGSTRIGCEFWIDDRTAHETPLRPFEELQSC